MTENELNDLYEQANEAYCNGGKSPEGFLISRGIHAVVDLVLAERLTADGEALGQLVRDVRDGDGHTAQIDGVLIAPCDTYGRVEAQHAQAPAPWDTLRAAAALFEGRGWYRAMVTECSTLAATLEAEHRADQEKATAEKAREALIEKAARLLFSAASNGASFGRASEAVQGRWLAQARALADAGLLADPDVRGDQ